MWCIIFFFRSAVIVFLYTFVRCSFTHCAAIKYLYIGLNLCTSFITHRLPMCVCVRVKCIIHKQRAFYENITIDIEYNLYGWNLPHFVYFYLLPMAVGIAFVLMVKLERQYSDVSDSEKKMRSIEMRKTCPSIVLLSAVGIYAAPD